MDREPRVLGLLAVSAPDALLAAALLRDPAGPLLTYYDDATGDQYVARWPAGRFAAPCARC